MDARHQRIVGAAEGLLKCLYEFAPEYPQACSEHVEELESSLAALDPGVWEKVVLDPGKVWPASWSFHNRWRCSRCGREMVCGGMPNFSCICGPEPVRAEEVA